MNKKIISLLLALLLTASATFTSCEGDPDTGAENTDAQTSEPAEDNFAGTPAYTVDGDYIVVDGVKYPNNNNYNSGPLVAIDDLDRVLPTQEQTKPAVTDGTKNVGIFYFLWMGEHGDSGAYNITEIIENGGVAAKNSSYEEWGPMGAMHHFAEPLYGFYYSEDTWVMRKHIEELTNAGVDFLYFDTTNGYDYFKNARNMMKILSEMREEGWDTPQVVFYTNTNSGTTALNIYNKIYSRDLFKDTWYMIDGKPVIIGVSSQIKSSLGANADFFTIKESQWPNSKKLVNGWPWMSFFQWDKGESLYNKYAGAGEVFIDEEGNRDAISVSVAQHCGTVAFSDSALYGDRTNHGRSYHDGRNHVTEDSYLYGYNFQEQWDQAIKANVPHILVTGWNEWVAQRNPFGYSKKVEFVDTASVEWSRDVEMMRGGYFDNYYMQLISNIRKYKGTAPTLVQNTRKKIDITGSFDQWDDILVTYSDMTGDADDRESTVFGKEDVKDTSGRNDIKKMKIVYDTKNIYFYVECANKIKKSDADSTWMQLFINIDNQTSGWYGYDYIVNYKATSDTESSVAKCTEDGKFAFEECGKVSYKIEEKKMMMSVSLADLGITDFNSINFSFKLADSDDLITTMEQMYTSGDQAPHGRLNFVFQNYK